MARFSLKGSNDALKVIAALVVAIVFIVGTVILAIEQADVPQILLVADTAIITFFFGFTGVLSVQNNAKIAENRVLAVSAHERAEKAQDTSRDEYIRLLQGVNRIREDLNAVMVRVAALESAAEQ